jgi:hypothetical protein
MSNPSSVPVVLELAVLPRDQVGPFLLLGVDKTADSLAVERSWAERLKLARKEQITVPLQDINWAREVLNDQDRRIRADAASLNIDTTDGTLRTLCEEFGGTGTEGLQRLALDVEKNLAEYAPAVEMPDISAVRASIVVGEIPEEVPAACTILEQYLREPLDPWGKEVGT